MDRQRGSFENASKRAEAQATDKEKVSNLLLEAARKAQENRGKLQEMWDGLNTLFRFVGAWVHGRYRVTPWRTIVLAIAGILYFLDPLDVVPDLVPFAGYLDDAGVIAFVLNSIRKDLDTFLEWERANSAAPTG